MSILAGSWHPHSPGPVEIHVGQLVTENNSQVRHKHNQNYNKLPDPLHGVHRKPQAVSHDDVVGGRDGALADVLRDEEEVVVVPPGHGVVQHGARRRVVQLLPHPDNNKFQ